MRKRKSERVKKIKIKKIRKERLHTFLYPAMEQCKQSPSHSGCFKLEKRSSTIHQIEGLMNWRGHPKMVMKRQTLPLPDTVCQPQPVT
jgi:hypothetical protein